MVGIHITAGCFVGTLVDKAGEIPKVEYCLPHFTAPCPILVSSNARLGSTKHIFLLSLV